MIQFNIRDAKIKKLEEENKKLRSIKKIKNTEEILEVLNFYADDENYYYIPKCKRKKLIDTDTIVCQDSGKKAKDIIKKLNNE